MKISWRTNLWLIPSLTVTAALVVLFVSQSLDRADYAGVIALPGWLDQGSAADARALLSATAGAIITTITRREGSTTLTVSCIIKDGKPFVEVVSGHIPYRRIEYTAA